jgi:hypothetical protein
MAFMSLLVPSTYDYSSGRKHDKCPTIPFYGREDFIDELTAPRPKYSEGKFSADVAARLANKCEYAMEGRIRFAVWMSVISGPAAAGWLWTCMWLLVYRHRNLHDHSSRAG